MHILIFNWRDLKHSWAGGGEIYVFELAKRWVKMGHTVTVFCGQDVDRKLSDTDSYDGIRIIRRGGRYTLYVWAVWYYLSNKLGKADIIVEVINGIPFFTPFFSKKPRVAFIYHVHEKQFFYELSFPINFIGFIIEKYISPIIYSKTKIIAISKTTKQELVRLGYDPRKISVVYCGVEKKIAKNMQIKKYSLPTLLYLGRIKAYKRVHKLVETFESLMIENPATNLVIAGWGTEASSVVDAVMKSKFRKRIKLLGPVSEAEKKSLLSKAWVFVNLSIGEGWGISVIEANRYGTPAVAFKVPGLSESIIHNKTGLLANNDQQLIKNINKILNDRKFREKLSENAKKWSSKFTWDTAAGESIKILEDIKRS